MDDSREVFGPVKYGRIFYRSALRERTRDKTPERMTEVLKRYADRRLVRLLHENPGVRSKYHQPWYMPWHVEYWHDPSMRRTEWLVWGALDA